MFASASYIAQLSGDRTRAAQLAADHARALLDRTLTGDDRAAIRQAMCGYAHRRDVLDQQIAWLRRDEGVCWPANPAWVD